MSVSVPVKQIWGEFHTIYFQNSKFLSSRLTYTKAMADLLYKCAKQKPKSCVLLMSWAQYVYSMTDHHEQAIHCMFLQGKFQQVVQYCQTTAKLPAEDFADLLRAYPTRELSQALVASVLAGGVARIPLGFLASVLLEIRLADLAVQLLTGVGGDSDSAGKCSCST